MLLEADEIEHRRSDSARRAEQVERHACALPVIVACVSDAAADRPKCLGYVECIQVAVEGLLGLVLAVDPVDVPVPFAAKVAVERRRAIIGLHALLEVAR